MKRGEPLRRGAPLKRTPMRPRRREPRRRAAPQLDAAGWDELSAMLATRCRGLCECCGEPLRGRVERAHRVRRRDGGDRASNVLMLLPEHHQASHQLDPADTRGVRLSAYTDDPASEPVLLWGRTWVLLDDQGGMLPCTPPPV